MHDEQNQEKKTTEEHIVEFIRTFAAIEQAMEPFKDQRRDLRENYSENGWLSKQEMRLAVRAYRLLKQDADFDLLTDYFNKLNGSINVV